MTRIERMLGWLRKYKLIPPEFREWQERSDPCLECDGDGGLPGEDGDGNQVEYPCPVCRVRP